MVTPASDRGVALVTTLLVMTLLGALLGSLSVLAVGELRVSATHRQSLAARYAAEAALALAVQEVARAADWNAVLGGLVRSPLVDGAASGTRQTASGTVDLTALTNIARCGRSAGCTAAAIAASTADRPWGADNPHWQPFLHGGLGALAGIASEAYVVVWVADDALECDGSPTEDGGACPGQENPGAHVIALRGAAFGSGGVVQEIEVTIGRNGPGGAVRLLSWKVVR